MHRIDRFLLLMLICTFLCCGCSQTRQVENQAYVIVLGVDETENGSIQLTAKVPVLSSRGGEQPSSGDAYTQISASGINYNTALKELNNISPRNLNLSQLELLVLSQKLTEKPDFRNLIEDIAQTERLYTASKIAICDENAGDFVKNLQPSIGTRLSLDIPATFENSIEQGLIPESTLADLYYLTETIYSDPMAACATLSTHADSSENSGESKNTNSKINFTGSAVFEKGINKLTLDRDETILANLLRNEVKYFRFEVGGKIVEAAPYAPAALSADLSSTPIRLSVKLRLNIGTQEDMPGEKQIKEKIAADVYKLIRKTQQHSVEPFGFSNSAAAKFTTIAKWQKYNWRDAYRNADIDIDISLTRWDA